MGEINAKEMDKNLSESSLKIPALCNAEQKAKQSKIYSA